MNQIISTVDKTSVKFANTFSYSINISFSGIVGSINSAKVKDFIPSYIDYILPPILGNLKNITQEQVSGGTLITFNFGSIKDLGISIAINLSCKFKHGTDNQTIFKNTSDLYINDVLSESSTSLDVLLNTNSDFIISKDIVVPLNKESSAGGRVIYSVILINRLISQGGQGDLGAKAYNLSISDILPSDIILDTNFPILGKDVSNNEYSDTRYDGKRGVIVDNTLTFELDNYYGTRYRVNFIANVSPNVNIGDQIVNTSTLNIGGLLKSQVSETLTISQATYGAYINKTGPNYAQIDNYISHDITSYNYANQDLINFIIDEKVPSEILPYRVNTGSLWIGTISALIPQTYEISYEINNSSDFLSLGTFNTSISTYVTLPSVSLNEKITTIRWIIPNFPVGASFKTPILVDGTILNTLSDKYINTAIAYWNDDTGIQTSISNHDTFIDNLSELNINKYIVSNNTNIIPGSTIRYRLYFSGKGSQINDPVMIDILPDTLEYIGNTYYNFYDYFDNFSIDSNNSNLSNFVNVLPPTIINNFNNTSQTLVGFKFDNFTLRQKGTFYVEFDVQVKIGSRGIVQNYALLGNYGNNGIVSPGYTTYNDTIDLDDDNVVIETLAKSNIVSSNVVFYVSLASDKKVKGALDVDYSEVPVVGKTYEGGNIDYKLTVMNNGNVDFESIEIVDILPYIGDTGVILTDEERLSEYNVYLSDNIDAEIINSNAQVLPVSIEIYQSNSYDPTRFSLTNFGQDTIGTDNDWYTSKPSSPDNVKSIKIKITNSKLTPGDSLVINLNCLVPLGVNPNNVSWNSFAVKASYNNQNNTLAYIIPVEPEKVGVQVLLPDANKVKIGSFVWIDKKLDGIYDIDESGVNGVIVELYDEKKKFIKKTITTNNVNNEPGYYLFNNLYPNNYFVKFIPLDNYVLTVQELNGGSTPNMLTKFTHLIDLNTLESSNLTIDAGIVNNPVLIEQLLLLLHRCLLNIDCDNDIDSINIAVNEFNVILNSIKSYLDKKLASIDINNYGYKAQLSRLLDIVTSFITIISNFKVTADCDVQFLAQLLFILIENTLTFISAIQSIDGLNAIYGTCDCLNILVFDKIMGLFINDITDLQESINHWNSLIQWTFRINNKHVSYTTSFIPNNVVLLPPVYRQLRHYCKGYNFENQ